MATKIVTKNSSTASAVPTASDLVQGELAVNVADKRLFTEDNAGAIVELGTNPYNFTANHDGSAKLATTSTGIDVTGTATMDSLTVDGTGDGVKATIGKTGGTNLNIYADTNTVYLAGSSALSTAYIIDQTNNNMQFKVNAAERMRIDSSGNVKINAAGSLLIRDDGTFIKEAGGLQIGNTSGTGTTRPIMFYTESAERMRIDSSGKLVVGRSSAYASGKIQSFVDHTSGFASPSFVAADSTAMAAGVGGEIGFYGKYSAADDYAFYGGIKGFKENGTDSNTACALSFYTRATGTAATERMRIDSSGNLLVGQTSNSETGTGIGLVPDGTSHMYSGSTDALMLGRGGSDGDILSFNKSGTTVGSIGVEGGANLLIGNGDTGIRFAAANNAIHPWNTTTLGLRDAAIDLGADSIRFKDLYLSGEVIAGAGANNNPSITSHVDTDTGLFFGGGNILGFSTGGAERARIDSSGNLLVGKTSSSFDTQGVAFRGSPDVGASGATFTRDGDNVAAFNRLNSDGSILTLNKDGTAVGSIGSLTQGGATNLVLDSTSAVYFDTNVRPKIDDTYDVGSSSYRFDDIYATNGTIQTSDRNEKQDIAELSDAEQRVAVACKGLLRKFRWKDSVAEKGDDARIHFGIIAQDLQAAFEAEGLDAGNYGMFTSTTWTDEETNEEKTRMGVRYSELLAFIIAAL